MCTVRGDVVLSSCSFIYCFERLRLILLRSLVSPGTPSYDRCRCQIASFFICRAESLFQPEYDAIAADSSLLEQIHLRAAASLRELRILSRGEGSPDELAYDSGFSALHLLASSKLGAQTMAAAHSDPNFVKDLVACMEFYLRPDPSAKPGSRRHLQQGMVLANGIDVCYFVSLPSQARPPQLLAFKDTLRCLGLAVAAGIHIMQTESGGVSSELLSLCVSNISDMLCMVFDTRVQAGDDSIPLGTDVGSWATHYQAMEGMLRLAALLQPSLPAHPGGTPDTSTRLPPELFYKLGMLFYAVHENEPSTPPDNQEVWSGLAGLIGSATKFSLLMARPEAQYAPEEKIMCLNGMVNGVSHFFMKLRDGKVEDESFPMR